MKNTLADFNNYLFEQLERLNDDSLTDEQLDREIKKTDTIIGVGDLIVRNGELAFKAMQHLDKFGYTSAHKAVPAMLAFQEDK